MDALMLSRIQFAVTVGFHFIFVPLTIGLVILLAVMETKYARTLNPLYRRMADFWGKLFAINFVLGIITGLTMEFQIGMNWSEYSKYMGDIFGSPLAIEALVAFFLESTFMGIWLFGRDKISPKLRAFSIWMVALGTNISALWIITANGFMQNPVGYVIRNNRAELESFTALVTNPYAWYMFFHTVISAYICGAFFVLAISAYHILRKNELEFFKKSFKYALVMALFASLATPAIGHQYGTYVVEKQPAKGAALEAVWETGKGQPFHLIQIPDGENEKNSVEAISIPKLGSFLFTNDPNGKITGLKDIPKDERPNVPLVFWSFRIMVALGMFFIFATAYGAYLQVKNKLVDAKRYLKIMSYSVVLPYIAINAGWVVAEAGRQPWTVYGLMKTADAVSPLATSQIVFSLGSLVFFYLILGFADIYLLIKYARKGPAQAINVQKGGVKHVS
ncbi:MAG: cytochrome bd-type quinol oxidase subunit 1 [Bacillales bacterium]|jgi:cytochrome d ubiquinol oxidase subunit I|nr:cytochrome bd-type quinol oxidase subunit 1 [Bacillales bacterium]